MKKAIVAVLAAAVLGLSGFGMTGCEKEEVIKVGVTDYEPMDYVENGKWTGFDAELATKVLSELGYKVEFVEINWTTKIVALNGYEIDVIWNGMTVTDELKENIALSDVYLENRQYGLVPTKDEGLYASIEDLTGKKVAFEAGSAAQALVEGLNCQLTPFDTQSGAVLEVAAGRSDVAVVDYTMAMTLTQAGTDYYGRLSAVDLGFEAEEYAVGFRKGDRALCEKVNAQLKKEKESGYIKQLAQKYGLEGLLKG